MNLYDIMHIRVYTTVSFGSSSEEFCDAASTAAESHTDKHGRQYVMVHSKKTVDYVGSSAADDSQLELQRRRMQLDRRYVRTYVCPYMLLVALGNRESVVGFNKMWYLPMYVRMYVCTYVCVYVCTYVCVYVCMFVRTFFQFCHLSQN